VSTTLVRPGKTGPRLHRTTSPVRTVVGILLCAVMLFPLYWMVNVSLTPRGDLLKSPPALFPTSPTFAGYERAFSDQLPFLGTSLIVALGSVALTILISSPAAYALAKLNPRGGSSLTFVLLVAQMIPGIIMATGFYAIYADLGLLNTLPGLILADSTLAVPFGILVMRAFMYGIPDDLIQAAKMDGASPLRTFVSIVLPLSRNSLVTVALFAFLFAWSDFLFAVILTSNGGAQPFTLGIYQYISNYSKDWNAIMATAVIASIPATILLIVAQRYVSAGITAGAVKD
jgi:multiple sugar transport system permease protein